MYGTPFCRKSRSPVSTGRSQTWPQDPRRLGLGPWETWFLRVLSALSLPLFQVVSCATVSGLVVT
jgi:hypothetical protein